MPIVDFCHKIDCCQIYEQYLFVKYYIAMTSYYANECRRQVLCHSIENSPSYAVNFLQNFSRPISFKKLTFWSRFNKIVQQLLISSFRTTHFCEKEMSKAQSSVERGPAAQIVNRRLNPAGGGRPAALPWSTVGRTRPAASVQSVRPLNDAGAAVFESIFSAEASSSSVLRCTAICCFYSRTFYF